MSAELHANLEIGGYRLLFRLGKGGMGEVWAATRANAEFGFTKLVALKVLRGQNMESNAAKMFFDEAKAAAVLHHQSIVPTMDLGMSGSAFYIAMEMVQGPSLTALLQRLVINQAKMSPAVVAHIGMALSSALDYAHERATHQGQKLKLVHRDVSPHNVLLDLNGAIRLTDFGVARTAIQDHESRVGTVRGKPSYMAPEQVLGGALDCRTDIFALGIVLYECSCLRRLFGRNNPVKSMDAVLKHDPKPLAELSPGFPAGLAAIIKKALDKDPNERYQTAGELHEALRQESTSLEAYESAGRELVALVHDNFDDGAFDTEARVQAALSEAPEPTAFVPSPSGNHMNPREGIGVWPSAHAPDPLAPEAIEEARTQFAAITPSGALPMVPQSAGDMTPLYSSVVTPAPQARRHNLLPPLLMALAAVVLVGAAWAVVQGKSSNQNAPIQAETPAKAPATATAMPSKKAPGVTQKRGAPATALSQAVEPPKPAKKKEPVERVRRRPTRTKTEPAAPEKKPAVAADATFEEVRDLVRQVKVVDQAKGSAMFATLAEAGRSNSSVLNQLRRQARVILKEN